MGVCLAPRWSSGLSPFIPAFFVLAFALALPSEALARFAFWQANVAAATSSQEAYLKASGAPFTDTHYSAAEFGTSVSVSGDTLVVGAINEDSSSTGINGAENNAIAADSGAVYVFTRSGTVWTQQAYIKASNTGEGDKFGASVSVDGDTLAVSATYEKSNSAGVNGDQSDDSITGAGAVYVFTRSGTVWSQQAYLKSASPGTSDIFGNSVSLSGNTIAVGVKFEDSPATGIDGDPVSNGVAQAGAVYVFTRSGTVWSQQAYVKASNTGGNDYFGISVSIDGDTLAVGAYGEASSATGIGGDQLDNTAGSSGAVYVFTRSGSVWSQQAYVKASNTGATDYFGYSVSVSGDTLAVGAYQEDSSATGIDGAQGGGAADSGAVYVFKRTTGVWAQEAYVKASNTGGSDYFGYSVSLSGDTLAVGAYQEDSSATGINGTQADETASNAGAVYVFKRTTGVWGQEAYVKASNTGNGDNFGKSLSVSGDTLAVGAHLEDSSASGINGTQADETAPSSGAVYVFTRSGAVWSQQAYVKASATNFVTNYMVSGQFGFSVSIDGNTLAVGAPYEDSNATGVGGNQTNNSAVDSGAVYVFTRAGTVWTQQAYIKASNTGSGDYFGRSVSINGDTLAVGAIYEDSNAVGIGGDGVNNSSTNSGAVYVFKRTTGVWAQEAYVKPSNTGNNDYFGRSVSVSGDTLAVGAEEEDSSATGINGAQGSGASNSGAVYVFTRSGTVWSQQAYVKASNTGSGDYFGISVSLSGDTLAVGAFGEDSNATGIDGNGADDSYSDAGAVYVFTRTTGVWSQQAYIKSSNPDISDRFGRSVSVSGDTLAVGAYWEDSNAIGIGGNQSDNSAVDSGAVYVFTRSGSVWSQQAYIKASNTGAGDYFGTSVDVSGDTLVVGAHYEDSSATGNNGNQANESATNSGAAYVFKRTGTVWSQVAYVKASNTGFDDRFGYSVSVSGNTVVVGAYQEDSSATGVNGNQADNNHSDSGAAYVFIF